MEIESADIYLTSIQRSYWSESAERYIDYDASAFAFKCPCCGAEIIINDKEIPEKVRESIRSVYQNKKAKQKYKESIESE